MAAVASLIFILATVHGPAFAQVQQRDYGSVQGWNIEAVFVGPKLAYCSATTATRGYLLRVAHDGRTWQVGREGGPGAVQGRIDLDGLAATVNFVPIVSDGWVFVTMANQQVVDRVRNGRTVAIAIGNARPVRFALRGVSNAMSLLEECVHRAGVAAQSRPNQPAPKAAPPRAAANIAQTGRNAGACPAGERPLPETRLCPAEALEAFLHGFKLNEPAQLSPGCTYGLNETNMAGDVLLYRALKCGNWIAKLDYAGGAHSAELTSKLQGGAQDVKITVLAANPSDPKITINQFARAAIGDQRKRRQCYAQDADNGGYNFDLNPKAVQRLTKDGPYEGACGPYGRREDSSHWRSFGGNVWFIQLGQDAEYSVDADRMILLERDTTGRGLKGWKVKY